MGTGASAQWLGTPTVQTEHANVIKWVQEFEKKEDYRVLRPHAVCYVLGAHSLAVVEAIERKYGSRVTSLNLMQLLRVEIMSGSDKGRAIYNRIRRGHILPVSVNLAILAQEVQRMSQRNPGQVFLVHLVDSFPKSTFGLRRLLDRIVPRMSRLLFTKMSAKAAQDELAKRFSLSVAKFSASMYDMIAKQMEKEEGVSVSSVDCEAIADRSDAARLALALFDGFMAQARAAPPDAPEADGKDEASASAEAAARCK